MTKKLNIEEIKTILKDFMAKENYSDSIILYFKDGNVSFYKEESKALDNQAFKFNIQINRAKSYCVTFYSYNDDGELRPNNLGNKKEVLKEIEKYPIFLETLKGLEKELKTEFCIELNINYYETELGDLADKILN